MRFSFTYRLIASLLCVSIITSFVFPVFGMAEMIEHCADMQEMDAKMNSGMEMHHHSDSMSSMDHKKMMDCCTDTMEYSSKPVTIDHCQTSIDCDCEASFDEVENRAVVVQNFKVPLLESTLTLSHTVSTRIEIIPPPLWYSNSYSPPLLFLANESFLI